MTDNMADLEKRTARIEARLASHWALQTNDDFGKVYVDRAKQDIQASLLKLAVGTAVFLVGTGYVLINHATDAAFDRRNAGLIAKFEAEYGRQSERISQNFEWRRFHDFGKDYVNLAELYSKAPLAADVKSESIHRLLAEAEGYFERALQHGDMQASTYWELGELRFSYPIEMGVLEEMDLPTAIEYYKEAAKLYTESEIAKGWRAEAYYKMGKASHRLSSGGALKPAERQAKLLDARTALTSASDDYAKTTGLTDARTNDNRKDIIRLLAEIGQLHP